MESKQQTKEDEKMNEPKYRHELAIITPEKAEELLASSAGNRTIIKRRVEAYARDMKEGRWQPANMIIVDADGHLADGHHRLNAVIKAGVAVPMMIFRGLERSRTASIDTGRPRSAGDMLALVGGFDGVDGLRNKAAIVSATIRITNPDTLAVPTHDEIADFMSKNLDGVNAAYKDLLAMRRTLCVSSGFAAAAFLIRKQNAGHEDLVTDFMEKAITGQMIREGDPEYALRNALMKSRTRSDRTSSRVKTEAYYTIRAWNAYANGVKMVRMKTPGTIRNVDFSVATIGAEGEK